MASIRSQTWRFRILAGGVLVCLTMVVSCAKVPPPPPGPSAAEVSERLAALTDRIAQVQQTVAEAMSAGASAADVAPVRDQLAAVQEALDKARQLLGEGKYQEAMDRIVLALTDLSAAAAMARQVHATAVARQEEMRAAAESRVAQMLPCLDAASRAMRSAVAAGATEPELAAAKSALASASASLQETRALLMQGDVPRALSVLQAAEGDCLMARARGIQAGVAAAARTAVRGDSYTVQAGNTLWGISAQVPMYDNALMWPMIYKANRDRIRDPDVIHPNQVLTIPHHYAPEERDTAVQRARRRGPWRLGDGPDSYILEGVRR